MLVEIVRGGAGGRVGKIWAWLRGLPQWLADWAAGRHDLAVGEAENPRSEAGRAAIVRGRAGRKRSNTEIMKDLEWRAACELVEWLGGARIPRQLRKRLDETGKPAQAVEQLVKDLGCDIDLLGRGDAEERDRFLERLEMLASLDARLTDAPRRIRRLVGGLFQAKDMARLRELSEVSARLGTARSLLDDAARRVAPDVLACVEALRGGIEKAAAELDGCSLAEADKACGIAGAYLDAADRAVAAFARWESATARLGAAAPPAWRDAAHFKHAQAERLHETLRDAWDFFRTTPNLGPGAARTAAERIEAAVAEMETLAAEAEAETESARAREREKAGAAGESARGRERSAGGAKPRVETADQWLATLELPAGTWPTEKEINAAFRQAAKKHHPDANPGDPKAHERMALLVDHKDKLIDRARRHAKA